MEKRLCNTNANSPHRIDDKTTPPKNKRVNNHWQSIFVASRRELIPGRGPHRHRPATLPVDSRRITVHRSIDQTANLNPSEPTGPKSLEAKCPQPERGAASIRIFVLHEKRRNHFKTAYKCRTESIHRCEIRRRTGKIPNGSPHYPVNATNRIVQLERRHSLPVGTRSRVHRSLRRSEGCSMGKTVSQGTQNCHTTYSNYGQRRGIQSGSDDRLFEAEQTHRSPLPLPMARTTEWEPTNDDNPR